MLFFILFGTMFVLGFVESMKGVSYPIIKTEFAISYEQQGMMVSIISLSFVLFCFVAGIIQGSFGAKRALHVGFITMILGMIGIFLPPVLGLPRFLSVAAFFILAASFGLLEVSTNALAAQLFTSRAALLMSLLNFFYGVGSSFSPIAAGAITAAADWRTAYLLCIPLALIFFVPSVFFRFHEEEAGAGKEKRPGFFTAMQTPMVWVFSVVLGLMIGVEVCSVNWAGVYFQDVYNLDPKSSGAAFLSHFYIFFTISRLVGGFAIEKIGYLKSLFIGTLAALIILILGFAFGAKGIYILPFIGFFVAIFWPTILATAMGYFRKDAPIMTSAIIVISGALNSVIQYLIGLTNRLAGPEWGYRSSIFYAVLIIAMLVVLSKRIKQPYRSGGRTAPE